MTPKKKRNFLANVEYHRQKADNIKKAEIIGHIVAGLQQPMKDVLNLQIAKQIIDTQKLIQFIRNGKST